jgi:hypothetical protein
MAGKVWRQRPGRGLARRGRDDAIPRDAGPDPSDSFSGHLLGDSASPTPVLNARVTCAARMSGNTVSIRARGTVGCLGPSDNRTPRAPGEGGREGEGEREAPGAGARQQHVLHLAEGQGPGTLESQCRENAHGAAEVYELLAVRSVDEVGKRVVSGGRRARRVGQQK